MRDKGLPVELNDGTCVVWQVDPSAVTPKSYAQLGSATSAGDLRSAVVSAFNAVLGALPSRRMSAYPDNCCEV